MTDDVLLPELNRLRGHRNEMGRSQLFFFSTQQNELLRGIKKGDFYLFLHFVRLYCAPQEENGDQCLMDGVHLLFMPSIALQCSPFHHCNIVLLLLAEEAAGYLRDAAQGSEGQGHRRL